jgi:hypothetical protein
MLRPISASKFSGLAHALSPVTVEQGQRRHRLLLVAALLDHLAVRSADALVGREIVRAGDVRLDVGRRDARRGLALGLDFLLDCLVVHVCLSGCRPRDTGDCW